MHSAVVIRDQAGAGAAQRSASEDPEPAAPPCPVPTLSLGSWLHSASTSISAERGTCFRFCNAPRFMASGNRNPFVRKFCPTWLSLGTTLWQVEQGFPVCRLNAGIASAFSGAMIANHPETATLSMTVLHDTCGHMADPWSPSVGVTGRMIGCHESVCTYTLPCASSSRQSVVIGVSSHELAPVHESQVSTCGSRMMPRIRMGSRDRFVHSTNLARV
jgi:hypothetical protein